MPLREQAGFDRFRTSLLTRLSLGLVALCCAASAEPPLVVTGGVLADGFARWAPVLARPVVLLVLAGRAGDLCSLCSRASPASECIPILRSTLAGGIIVFGF